MPRTCRKRNGDEYQIVTLEVSLQIYGKTNRRKNRKPKKYGSSQGVMFYDFSPKTGFPCTKKGT